MRDQEIIGIWEAYQQVHAQPEEVEQLDEGMTLPDYKKKRSALKQKEKRESDKIAPTRRAGIHTPDHAPERAARHRANVDPDFEGNDEENYPGGRLRPKKVRKAKALGELGEGVDLFGTILEYLVAEGYAATNKEALVIMANMSEEWRESIVEAVGIVGPPRKAIDAIPGVRNLRIGLSNAVKASDYPASYSKEDIPTAGKHVVPRGNIKGGTSAGKPTAYKDISGDK